MESILLEGLQECKDLPIVVDVRSKGAIGAIQVTSLDRLDELRSRFVDAGVWLRPFGDVIYMTPALNMDQAELETLCSTTVRVVHDWTKNG